MIQWDTGWYSREVGRNQERGSFCYEVRQREICFVRDNMRETYALIVMRSHCSPIPPLFKSMTPDIEPLILLVDCND